MSDDSTPPARPVRAAPPVSEPVPVSDGNEEFPIPFARFAVSLQHTADEIWIGLLQAERGRENHKPSEWSAILDACKGTPAHPEHPEFKG